MNNFFSSVIRGTFSHCFESPAYSSALCLLVMRMKYMSNIVPMLDLQFQASMNKVEAKVMVMDYGNWIIHGGKEKENPFRIKGPWRRSSETISSSYTTFGFCGVTSTDVVGCHSNLLIHQWVDGMIHWPYCQPQCLFERARPNKCTYRQKGKWYFTTL